MAQLKAVHRITFADMIKEPEVYKGLSDGLVQLPLPDKIKIKRKRYHVPQSAAEFMQSICYGQRIYFDSEEKNDYGVIFRVITGYYYPIITRSKWNGDNALLFGKYLLNCKVNVLYPVAMTFVKYIAEMTERERNLLHREPSKLERAAGIEKLNRFADLTSLDFLRDEMKMPIEEVLLQPYNECLVRFMLAKEKADYQERYYKLLHEETEMKIKRKK